MSQINLFQQAANPGAPAAGQVSLFAKTDNRFYGMTPDGTAHKLAHSGEAETFLALSATTGAFTDNVTVTKAGAISLKVRNTTAGAAQSSQFSLGSDNDPDQLFIKSFSSTYTPTAMERAAGVLVNGEGAGGLTLGSTQADMKFFTGVPGVGVGILAMTITGAAAPAVNMTGTMSAAGSIISKTDVNSIRRDVNTTLLVVAGGTQANIDGASIILTGSAYAAPSQNLQRATTHKFQSMDGSADFASVTSGGLSLSSHIITSSGQLALGAFGSSGLQLINDGTIGTVDSQALKLRVATTERVQINTNGYFKSANGGTYFSSGGSFHEFNNNAANQDILELRNSSAGPYGLYIGYSAVSPVSASNFFIDCADSTFTRRFAVASNGGISNYSANNVNLSDESVKPVIQPIDDFFEEWAAIDWNKNMLIDQTHQDWNYGYSAQNIHSIFARKAPGLVTMWSHSKLGVHENDFYNIGGSVLTQAVRRIKALEETLRQNNIIPH